MGMLVAVLLFCHRVLRQVLCGVQPKTQRSCVPRTVPRLMLKYHQMDYGGAIDTHWG